MARVLVIDDESDNRALVVTLLRYAGHEACEAGDGAQGLLIAQAQRPDLVVCDLLMPTMDGYEFVRRLRNETGIAHTEVIFWTATFLEREARKLALACGVTRVLTKPTEPELILETVAQALAQVAPAAAGRVVTLPQPRADDFSAEHLRVVSDKLLAKVAELEVANQRLSALNQMSLLLASERDPHTLLDRLCRGARELLGARAAVLCVKDPRNGADLHRSVWGLDAEQAEAARALPFMVPVAQSTLIERRPQRFGPAGPADAPVELGAGLPPLASGLIVPVASLEHVYGWLLLIDKLGEPGFSADDEALLVTHAAQAGRIFENGSLYARVQRHLADLRVEIAERQRGEAQLRQSEARLAGLVESAMDGIVAVDNALRIVLFNPAAAQMFGYRTAEMLGQPLDRLLPEDHRGTHDSAVRAFGSGGAGRARWGAWRAP